MFNHLSTMLRFQKLATINFSRYVTKPVIQKYFLRPNIKGTTKEHRLFSTTSNYTNLTTPVKLSAIFTRDFHSTKSLQQVKEKDDLVAKSQVERMERSDKNDIETFQKDAGLGVFLKNVYISTGLGFSGALATSLVAAHVLAATPSPEIMIATFAVGAIGSIASIFAFEQSKPKFVHKLIDRFDNRFTMLSPEYTTSKYVSSVTLCASMGLVMAPLVMITGPALVAQAAGISLAVMAGSSFYSQRAKPGSLLLYKSTAYGALTGLVGISASALVCALFFGNGQMFELLHSVDLYGGLALFTVLNAIDTQNAVYMYMNKQPDYLGCSIAMILNALNIFIRILEILAKAQKK